MDDTVDNFVFRVNPWGLSTVVHENPKPAAVFESFVHRTAHTTGLWLM